jgi:hypothetical protein
MKERKNEKERKKERKKKIWERKREIKRVLGCASAATVHDTIGSDVGGYSRWN